MVEPVHVFEGGVLDLVTVLPRGLLVDRFCFTEANDRLGQGLSYGSPTDPTDGEMPASARRLLQRIDRY